MKYNTIALYFDNIIDNFIPTDIDEYGEMIYGEIYKSEILEAETCFECSYLDNKEYGSLIAELTLLLCEYKDRFIDFYDKFIEDEYKEDELMRNCPDEFKSFAFDICKEKITMDFKEA